MGQKIIGQHDESDIHQYKTHALILQGNDYIFS